MDLLYRTVQVVASLQVDVHHHGAQLGGLLDISLGLHDHVVYVERLLAQRGNGLEHRETERYIGDEHTVHHIQMKPVGLTTVYHFKITVEVQEVGCKQRRRN